MKLNTKYLTIAIILFIIEVLIATFLKSGFIRHTFGDFLVVILIYTAIKSCFNFKVIPTVIGVLIFSFVVETLQLTPFLSWFKLENNTLAKLIFGTTFHFTDLIVYTLGCIFILIVEFKIVNYEHSSKLY